MQPSDGGAQALPTPASPTTPTIPTNATSRRQVVRHDQQGTHRKPSTPPDRIMAAGRKHPVVLTERHHQILRAVHRYHFLSAAQLTHLQFSRGSLTYSRALLKLLADGRYLERIPVPAAVTGRAPLLYGLSPRGKKVLEAAGDLDEDGRRARHAGETEHAYLFLNHTSAVNDFLIAAERLDRTVPDVVLAAMRHERDLKHLPVRVTTARGEVVSVIPDGWLSFHIRAQAEAALILELDRATVEQKAIKRKLRALVAFANGPYERAYGTQSLTIAFATTAGEHRRALLRCWCEEVLRDLHEERQADLFRFAALPLPPYDPRTLFLAPCWFVPFAQPPTSLIAL